MREQAWTVSRNLGFSPTPATSSLGDVGQAPSSLQVSLFMYKIKLTEHVFTEHPLWLRKGSSEVDGFDHLSDPAYGLTDEPELSVVRILHKHEKVEKFLIFRV